MEDVLAQKTQNSVNSLNNLDIGTSRVRKGLERNEVAKTMSWRPRRGISYLVGLFTINIGSVSRVDAQEVRLLNVYVADLLDTTFVSSRVDRSITNCEQAEEVHSLS